MWDCMMRTHRVFQLTASLWFWSAAVSPSSRRPSETIRRLFVFLVVVGLYSLSELLKRSHSTLTPLQLQMSKKNYIFCWEEKNSVSVFPPDLRLESLPPPHTDHGALIKYLLIYKCRIFKRFWFTISLHDETLCNHFETQHQKQQTGSRKQYRSNDRVPNKINILQEKYN